MNIEIIMPRRRAEATLKIWHTNTYGIEQGLHPCHVLGIFPCADDDWSGPMAVVEMDDGKVIEVAPDCIRFTDTVEGMIIE